VKTIRPLRLASVALAALAAALALGPSRTDVAAPPGASASAYRRAHLTGAIVVALAAWSLLLIARTATIRSCTNADRAASLTPWWFHESSSCRPPTRPAIAGHRLWHVLQSPPR
jgi:hypothetical protein